MLRAKNIKWDYNDDGRFEKERIPKFWKRFWNKWNKRRLKKEIEKIEGVLLK